MAEKGTKFDIRNSWGVYDAYKLMRKNHWYNIGRPVKEKEFYAIIRGVNDLLSENIVNGETVVFPEGMGSLELRKYEKGVFIKNGKLMNTYPIDWKSTNQLWKEDAEERKKHTLLRYETPFVYHVRYCKDRATYENKTFYRFKLNKFVKVDLKNSIITGKTDTLW